jgi:hypothetical protein
VAFVGWDEKVKEVREKVGVTEYGSMPLGSQEVRLADFETSKSRERPMLAPVIVIGDGRSTVTLDDGVSASAKWLTSSPPDELRLTQANRETPMDAVAEV